MKRHLYLLFFLILTVFAACDKQEKSVTLPAESSTLHSPSNLVMGDQYLNQLFYDFESNSVVFTSEVNSWDLAFEPAVLGYHVFINGNKCALWNTHETDFGKCTTPPPPTFHISDWKADAHCGLADSTAIGEWKNGAVSKNEVYVLKEDSSAINTYKKIQILSVTGNEYVIAYGNIEDQHPHIATIAKDARYAFNYFSFNNGVVYPEPPKDSWDIVFTRYAYMFYGQNLPPYRVTGVLFNPGVTSGVNDSTIGYDNINITTISTVKFSNDRDVIGYDWKTFDYNNSSTAKYIIDKKKSYIVYTRKDKYYKLRFLSFYGPDGAKGTPSFEFERLH